MSLGLPLFPFSVPDDIHMASLLVLTTHTSIFHVAHDEYIMDLRQQARRYARKLLKAFENLVPFVKLLELHISEHQDHRGRNSFVSLLH